MFYASQELGWEDHLRTDTYVEWDIKLRVQLDGLTLSPKMLAQLFGLQFIVQMSFHSGLIKGYTYTYIFGPLYVSFCCSD